MNEDQSRKDKQSTPDQDIRRIQDILLGEKYQDIDKQFEKLAQQTSKESKNLYIEIMRLRHEFEIYVDVTINSLIAQVEKNKLEQLNLKKKLEAELHLFNSRMDAIDESPLQRVSEISRNLYDLIAKMDRKYSNAFNEFRRAQSKELNLLKKKIK